MHAIHIAKKKYTLYRNDSLTLSFENKNKLASIFKRMSDVPDMDYNISQDFTAAYKVSSSPSLFKTIYPFFLSLC